MSNLPRLCVSLRESTNKRLRNRIENAAADAAELVELRLDGLEEKPDLQYLLTALPTKVIVTCSRRIDPGAYLVNDNQRRRVYGESIKRRVDYIDAEIGLIPPPNERGSTQLIASHNDFISTPLKDTLDGIYRELDAESPDIIRITTTANMPSDMLRVLALNCKTKPTLAFCMGELGVPSRILSLKYGAPFTYAAHDKRSLTANGQQTFERMRDCFRCNQINSRTKILGVVGDPVLHSLSPAIHNAALDRYQMNTVYIPFLIPQNALQDTLNQFEPLEIQGLSVTIPHKEEAMLVAGDLNCDVTARQVGASNTLYRHGSTGFRAENTDCQAAVDSIRMAIGSNSSDSKLWLNGQSVLVLGAGGASRAVALGALNAGAEVMITGRTFLRAESLAREIGCSAIPREQRTEQEVDILVNCTPVGLYPNEATPMPIKALRPSMIVFDTVYIPRETLLLRQAQSVGCRVVYGSEMFLRQAVRQFRLFTGHDADAAIMKKVFNRALLDLTE